MQDDSPRRSPPPGATAARAGLRLCIVTQDFPPAIGGIQTYAHELTRRLVPHAEALVVLAPSATGSTVVDGALDVEVVRVPGGAAFPATHAPVLARVLAARRIRTVLAMHWGSSLPAAALRRAGGLDRLVTAVYGRDLLLRPWASVPRAQQGYDAARHRALSAADAVVGCSRYTVSLATSLGVPPDRAFVVPGGVDPARFRPMDAASLVARHGLEGDRVVLTLGRLVKRKGADVLIRALAVLLRRVPRARLVVAGDGPERARLGELAREVGVEERVLFVGRVPEEDLVRWYSAAEVFAMPSRLEPPDVEGFGIVYLEASACGVPVVGPDEGGPLDAIVPGETGLVCDPRDPGAVAAALATLLEDPARARAMGRAGRAYVEREGTWEHAVQRLLPALG